MGFAIKTKLKRRNSEKRKEKSRDAARTRRSKETEIFSSLSKEIPISFSVLSQMDKASVIRLAITHLKMRNFCELVLDQTRSAQTFPSVELENKLNKLYYKALNGFLMVLNNTGNLIYSTESIMHHLGLPQVELLGQSIFDFVHPCDHAEIRDVCGINKPLCPSDDIKKNVFNLPQLMLPSQEDEKLKRNFFVRMKCIHPCKGRSVSVKASSYKVVHCSGFLISSTSKQNSLPSSLTSHSPSSSPMTSVTKDVQEDTSFLVVECDTILHPSNQSIRLDSRSFVTHHTLDMKFIYCDDGVSSLLGYSPGQLIGSCLYDFHHALDNNTVYRAYKTLFSKGQSVTGLYRFLAKNGGYAWVETQASLVKNPQTDKPQSVICINSVVSGILHESEVLGLVQQPSLNSEVSDDVSSPDESALNLIEREHSCHLKIGEDNREKKFLINNYRIPEVTLQDAHHVPLNENHSTVDDGDDNDEELDVVEEIEIDEAVLCDERFDNGGVMFATEKILDSAKSLNVGRSNSDMEENDVNPYFEPPHSPRVDGHESKARLPTVSSSASLFKLLKEFDDENDELRAPFIPMDDLIFVNDTSTSSVMSPIETHSIPFLTSECRNNTSVQDSISESDILQDDATTRSHHITMRLASSSKTMKPADSNKFKDLHQSFCHILQTAAKENCHRKMEMKEEDNAIQTSSVLMNLLLKGEDTNYGYRLKVDNHNLQHEAINENGSPTKVSALYQLLCS